MDYHRFVNLTKYNVMFQNSGITLKAAEIPASMPRRLGNLGGLAGIYLYRHVYSPIEGVPPPDTEGVVGASKIYVTMPTIARAMADRMDVLAPYVGYDVAENYYDENFRVQDGVSYLYAIGLYKP